MVHNVHSKDRSPNSNMKDNISLAVKGLQTCLADYKLQKQSVLQTASHLYEGLNTPTSLGLWLCIKYDDINSIVKHTFSFLDYESKYFHSSDYIDRNYQAVTFLKKVRWDLDGVDPTLTAVCSVREYEARCASTNKVFQAFLDGGLIPTDQNQILHLAIDLISRTLGSFSADEWVESCRFGPGVSYLSGSTCYDKMRAKPSVTPGFATLGLALINMSPGWISAILNKTSDFSDDLVPDQKVQTGDVALVFGGKFSLVPKTALTHRDIEIQPLINGFAQLGIGRMLRLRLKRAGLDLDRQTIKNRYLAWKGSLLDHNVTIDLKGASNTIAKKLVEFLLPIDWFVALDICRTRYLEDFPTKGDILPLERFSSMGNGYTFELESLIFWALTKSCAAVAGQQAGDEIAVFGDDIICEKETSSLLLETLDLCGFLINREKSFFSGPFRESCGSDYLRGQNIRPYFFKGKDADDIQTAVSMCNGLRRKSMQSSQNLFSDTRYKLAWIAATRNIPKDLRLSLIGPMSENDTWIISDDGDYLRNKHLQYAQCVWWMPTLRMAYKEIIPTSYTAAKAAMLWSISCMETPQNTGEDAWLADQCDELLSFNDIGSRRIKPFRTYNRGNLIAKLDVTPIRVDPCGLWF